MENDLEKLIGECEKKITQGASREELILHLKQEGLTIIESMKVVKKIYKVSLQEAKEMVTTHSAWVDEARVADSLHEELEELFHNEENK